MADLLDRLSGDNLIEDDPFNEKVPVHSFYAALVAFADGQLTRVQIENGFNIETTGQQATDLNFIINTYTGITGNATAIALKQQRYLERLHTIFMLAEHEGFNSVFSKAEVSQWLTDIAAGTI